MSFKKVGFIHVHECFCAYVHACVHGYVHVRERKTGDANDVKVFSCTRDWWSDANGAVMYNLMDSSCHEHLKVCVICQTCPVHHVCTPPYPHHQKIKKRIKEIFFLSSWSCSACHWKNFFPPCWFRGI